MKNFNDIVPITKTSFVLADVSEREVDYEIYKTLFKEVMHRYLDKGGELVNVLDMFCSQSFVKECLDNKENPDINMDLINYKSQDDIPSTRKMGVKSAVDLVCGINDIQAKENEFDIAFCPGGRVGYGRNHKSMFEIERVVKSGGYLISCLTKHWFWSAFNQMLFCCRDWDYLEAVEVSYKYTHRSSGKSANTSKFFTVYKNSEKR